MKRDLLMCWAAAVLGIFLFAAFRTLSAQAERSTEQMKVWETSRTEFSGPDWTFPTRTVYVYKIQTGTKMRCYATLSQSDTILLGEVPCD